MRVYQIIDKATGEKLVRLTADGVKRARWTFYATKGFHHHGPVICREITAATKPDVSMEVGTHRGVRLKVRGDCEKCGTPTNWTIIAMGRSGAYWCGCGN